MKNKKLLLIPVIAFVIFLMFKRNLQSPTGKVVFNNEYSEPQKIELSASAAKLPPPEKISFWIEAQQLVGKRAAQLKSWKNLGRAKVNLAADSPKLLPVIKENAVNDFAAIVFDGTSFVSASDVTGSDLINTDEATVFAVLKQNFSSEQNFSEFFGWGDCATNRLLSHINGDGTINFHFGVSEQHVDSLAPANIVGFSLISLSKTPDKVLVEINGKRMGSFPNTSTLNPDYQSSLFLGTSACGHGFRGELAEIMILKGLNLEDKNQLTRYLIEKYKLGF